MFEHHRQLLEEVSPIQLSGRLESVSGLSLVAEGFPATVGSMCRIEARQGQPISGQVVGFQGARAVLMALDEPQGAAPGDIVHAAPALDRVPVGASLLGRVVDGLGRPIDQGGRIHPQRFYPVYDQPPRPMSRRPIDSPLGTGIRALDSVLTVGKGQRLGFFAGTGVGKSVLLGMIARYTQADVIVAALVGERGREVKDFIDKDIGSEGMDRTVMVVSTSDESPVMRVRACFVATAIAEYFRDEGSHVLLLMDSLTRMAMAQRQIGLAAGEPPATKGYTPSVFSLMPKLLERSGNTEKGSITGFYSVLVEGDDLHEPISDAVRGVLDGHVWLARALAGRGHYPAIDVINSISRLMVDVVDQQHYRAAQRVRRVLGTWLDIEDLVNIGAYAGGTNVQFDVAVQMKPRIDDFLRQAIEQRVDLRQVRDELLELGGQIETLEEELSRKASRKLN